MVPFAEKWGVRGAMTSGVDLLNGLAVLAGIDRLEIEGVTDGADNDYAAQADGALAALDDHDVVVIHVESPDEEGHAGDWHGQDRGDRGDRPRGRLARQALLGGALRLLAMPDHPTPVELKTHVGEPVPFVLWGPGVESNGASDYCERSAESTGLLLDPGRRVMGELLGYG